MNAQFTHRRAVTKFEVDDPPPREFRFRYSARPDEGIPVMTLTLALKAVRNGTAIYRVKTVKMKNVTVGYPK
jgi:hypothetical protein